MAHTPDRKPSDSWIIALPSSRDTHARRPRRGAWRLTETSATVPAGAPSGRGARTRAAGEGSAGSRLHLGAERVQRERVERLPDRSLDRERSVEIAQRRAVP